MRFRLRTCKDYVTCLPVRPFGGQWVTIVLGVIVVGLSVSLLAGSNGLRRLRELRNERQAQAEQALVLMDGNRHLREDIHRLQHDPDYLERLARRELQRVLPNEVVYRFGRGGRRP